MATPRDIRNIKEAQAELKKLNDEYRKLTGKKLFDIPTQDFELHHVCCKIKTLDRPDPVILWLGTADKVLKLSSCHCFELKLKLSFTIESTASAAILFIL